MLGPLFENIDRQAIDQLIADGVSETQHLEYKERLPGRVPADKKEFLADVAAFANTSGGDLVFGVAEKRDGNGKPTGTPDFARGVGTVNVDAELLRLDSMIRSGITPRVPVRTVAVEGFPDGAVIVLRIPRTMTGPHMVVFEGHNRFYGRSNGGKFPLGIDDIRLAFNAASDAVERGFRFRDSRIAAVMSGETPVKIKGPALLLLIVPQNATIGIARFDPRSIGQGRVPLPISGGANGGWVAEGLVARANNGYTLVMRSGIVEMTHDFFREEKIERPISLLWVARETVGFVRRTVELLQTVNLHPPYVVLSTFIGVKDYPVAIITEFGSGYYERKFDRDLLTLPDVALPSADPADVIGALQPMFDAMWQAIGEWCDPHYGTDEAAKW